MHCCYHQGAQKLVFPFEFEERSIMEMYLPNGDKRLILSDDDAAGVCNFFRIRHSAPTYIPLLVVQYTH